MQKTQFSNQLATFIADTLGLAIVFSVFYFIWLGHTPLFTPDEGRYTEIAREMLRSHDFVTPRLDAVPFLDKPALYYWLQAAALGVFGIKEVAVRFFPACFGIAGCLLCYGFGRALFNRRTGLLAALLLATSPLYFAAAHYANLDLEVAVLISGSLLSLITALKNPAQPKVGLLYLAYAFAGFAFLTKGMIAIAFPALILAAWILLLGRWSVILRLRLFTGLLLSAAIALPWYALAQHANPDFLHYFFVEQQVSRFLSTGEFNNKTPFWFYLPIVLIGFLPWTSFLFQSLVKTIQSIWANKQAHATELFLVCWLAIVFVFFSIPHSKTITYILPVFPPMALLTAHTLSTKWASAKNHALPAIIFTVLCSLFGSALLLDYHFHWLALSSAMTPTLTALGCLLIFGGVISLCLSRVRLPILLGYLTAWSVAFLLILTANAPYLNDRTIKPLLPDLKAQLQPTDAVVSYYDFYQDLPLYLDRTITIVADWQSPTIPTKDNWQRELWVQMKDRKENNLIDNAAFATRWRSHQRLFVFLDQKYLSQFQATVGEYHLINQYKDVVLVSNQG